MCMSKSAAEFRNETNVSRETFENLKSYEAVLRKWNPRINLVSPSSLDNLWSRHMMDSAQVFRYLPESAKNCVDLGSGAGFPGIVLAIMAAGRGSEVNFTLIEADQRKAAFLRTVSRETMVPFCVISDRIERVQPKNADVLTARALAPLSSLLDLASRHLAVQGRCFFLKGASASREIEEALETWRFDCKTYASQTADDAVILDIGAIERV